MDGEWYDLSAWRVAHPAGTHWIDGFANRDATDVLHAFHSAEALAMTSRLPRLKSAPPSIPPTSALTLGFRKLRAELLRDGWFERVWWREALNVAPIVGLYTAGTVLARTTPLLATALLALGSTGAGWVAHDFVHGRGAFCSAMRGFGALFNAHSATWWSNKHNLHHACALWPRLDPGILPTPALAAPLRLTQRSEVVCAFVCACAGTNQVGVDEDIMADPFFFLWAPDPARDSKWRRLQHLYAVPVYSILFALPLPFHGLPRPSTALPLPSTRYAVPVYSILFALWRFNSLRTVVGSRLRGEGCLLLANYAWMALCLPLPVALGHIFFAGVMTATIVTVSHQAEELFHEHLRSPSISRDLP